MIDVHGIEMPFTMSQDGPDTWPSHDENGRTQAPGHYYWRCDACGRVAWKMPRGGLDLHTSHPNSAKLEALRFHVEMCPELRSERG